MNAQIERPRFFNYHHRGCGANTGTTCTCGRDELYAEYEALKLKLADFKEMYRRRHQQNKDMEPVIAAARRFVKTIRHGENSKEFVELRDAIKALDESEKA